MTRRTRILPSLLVLAAAMAASGCGEEPRAADAAPGDFRSGGPFSPFYGETLFDGRIYLFGQEHAWDKFLKSHDSDPTKVKSFIGAGPNHETVIVQTDKEAPQMTDRLVSQFNERHGIK